MADDLTLVEIGRAIARVDKLRDDFSQKIKVLNEVRGALLFASSKPTPWPDTIANISAFLADQFALYLAFDEQMRHMKDAQTELEGSVQERANLLMDFQHQLRSPLRISVNSIKTLETQEPMSSEWKETFEALTSATYRAKTVSNNLQQFVNLAQGKKISVNKKSIPVENVFRRIRMASEFLYNKKALDTPVRIDVVNDPPINAPPHPQLLFGDMDLIELVLDNLLE